MKRLLRPTRRLLCAAALLCLMAGCVGYQPKEYTANDRCRDCGEGGGIFSGEDGVFTYEL